MRIKLAVLDKDKNYVDRISAFFTSKYADKFEIYSFTDKNLAHNSLEESKIDIFLANADFEIDESFVPHRCVLGYLVETSDIDIINGQRAINKFQKIDQIYKQILSIYAEKAGNITGLKFGDDNCKTIIFSSPSGGTGTSTVAAACAIHFAKRGNKTLYLNLELFGSSDTFFFGDGQFDMSDIVFAIKSNKANLPLKLESCVKQDQRGPFFYSGTKLALDRLELSLDDINRMYSEIKLTGSYDVIIVDIDFRMDKRQLDFYRNANYLVFVSDGSPLSNEKTVRAYDAISTLEENEEFPVNRRIGLIYNKFSNKTSSAVSRIELKALGGVPRFEHATTEQILNQISEKDFFDKLLQI